MRILSLGYGLPDSQIDNHNWANAPAFFDYDAMVVDPAQAVSGLITELTQTGETYVTYTDEPVLDGPTTDSSVGLADLLRQRRGETERMLAKGGLIICFTYPDVPHPKVTGFTGCHRYYWLPAPLDCDYGPDFVRPATGKHVSSTDYENPFADFLDLMRDNVLYRAFLTEGAAGFGESLRVIGRSPGGAAIATELSVGGGRVVFLPALPPNLSHSERSKAAGKLVSAVRNALLLEADDEPPEWLAHHLLPELTEAKERADTAETRLDEIELEMTEARNAYRGIDRYRRLLWQEGKFGLDLPVRDVLGMLGFKNMAKVDDPPSFNFDGESVFVEIEGSSGSIGMNPHYRLRQRLEQRIAETGKRTRGLIVVNGQRELNPSERSEAIDDSLRVAAESMRYCIVDSTHLFDALRDHMEGKGDTKGFCRELLATEGVFKPMAPAENPSSEETNEPGEETNDS